MTLLREMFPRTERRVVSISEPSTADVREVWIQEGDVLERWSMRGTPGSHDWEWRFLYLVLVPKAPEEQR